jgi:hypothetical protein
MALAPHPAFAAVLGSRATNLNIPLPAGTWTTLNQIPVPAANEVRYCTAVGSADVRVPPGINTTYLFTLTLDPQPPMNLGQERTVQSVPGGPRIKEVTTTQGFTLESDVAYVIYWLGRPALGNPPAMALDRSMTVVCDKEGSLGIRNFNPERLIEDEE